MYLYGIVLVIEFFFLGPTHLDGASLCTAFFSSDIRQNFVDAHRCADAQVSRGSWHRSSWKANCVFSPARGVLGLSRGGPVIHGYGV